VSASPRPLSSRIRGRGGGARRGIACLASYCSIVLDAGPLAEPMALPASHIVQRSPQYRGLVVIVGSHDEAEIHGVVLTMWLPLAAHVPHR